MLNSDKGQSLIEVLVVLVVAAMMIVALTVIILTSLKNAQFAQNQTKATKIAQDTIDNIRILRDSNQKNTLTVEGTSQVCFKELWNNASDSAFYCGSENTGDCYYKLNTDGKTLDRIINLPSEKIVLTNNPGFFRQIKINQTNVSEIKLAVEISWTDSTGEHGSNLETYLTKPDYDCSD